MIEFVRGRFKLVCLICFGLTTGFGILGLLAPGIADMLAGTTIDITDQSKFFAYSTFIMIAIAGFWFLIIMMDPEANKPLLGLAIAEKFIFVGFMIYAMGPLKLSWMFIPIVLGDLAMGAVCLLYLVLGPLREEVVY